jgi:hypothetical protein
MKRAKGNSMKLLDRISKPREEDPAVELSHRLGAMNLAIPRYCEKLVAHTARRDTQNLKGEPTKEAVDALALRILAGDDPDAVPRLPDEAPGARDLRVLRALQLAVEIARTKSAGLWLERGRRERESRLSEWREAVRARALAIVALQGANARCLLLEKEIRGGATPGAVPLPGWNAILNELQHLCGTGDTEDLRRVPSRFNPNVAEYLRAVVREGIVTEAELEKRRMADR